MRLKAAAARMKNYNRFVDLHTFLCDSLSQERMNEREDKDATRHTCQLGESLLLLQLKVQQHFTNRKCVQ